MVYKNNDELNELIGKASKAVGTDADNLKKTIDSGKLDDLVKKMKPQDAKKLEEIIKNPKLAEQMLKTPQAQALIKHFMKK